MMNDMAKSGYYLTRRDAFWKRLQRLLKSSTRVLPQYADASLVAGVGDETYQEFRSMLSVLPYIGGDENPLTFTLVSAAAALAYIRALESRGFSVDTTGKILNAVYDDAFASLPRLVKWWLRSAQFSTGYQNKLRTYAEKSQRREYPGDWVMAYVEGDGEQFDVGCDYTECAVLKFFRHMKADRYMPYVCVMDFTMSRALRTGLTRTTSLYYGGQRCDFRYKKNSLGQAALPIEELPEYQNRSQ